MAELQRRKDKEQTEDARDGGGELRWIGLSLVLLRGNSESTFRIPSIDYTAPLVLQRLGVS